MQIYQKKELPAVNKKYKFKLIFSLVLFISFSLIAGMALLLHYFLPKQQLVKYSFGQNMTYNFKFTKNSSYLKGTQSSNSNTTYFVRLICQQSQKDFMRMMYLVENITVRSQGREYSNQIFPEVQKMPIADDQSQNPKVVIPDSFQDYSKNFLNFRFSYNLTINYIYDIQYPNTIDPGFKSMIPKLIEMVIPNVNRSLYQLEQGFVSYKPGIGNITQFYSSDEKDGILKLRKTFQKAPQTSQKSKNYFNYTEEAFFNGNKLIMNNLLSVTTSKNEQQKGDGSVNMKSQDLITIQNLGISYVGQYKLEGANMTLFKIFYQTNKQERSSNITDFKKKLLENKQIIVAPKIPQRRQLFDITDEGITFLDFKQTKYIIKTNFFGQKIQGFITYYISIKCVNQSNKYIPTFIAGGGAYAVVGPRQITIMEQRFVKTTPPITLSRTLLRVIQFIIKNKQKFQLVFQLAKTLAEGVQAFKELQGKSSLAEMKPKFQEVANVILRVSSENNVNDQALKFKKDLQVVMDIFNTKIKTCVEQRAGKLTQLKQDGKFAVQQIKQQAQKQFAEIQQVCRRTVFECKLNSQFKQLNKQLTSKNKFISDKIINNQFMKNQYKKSLEAVQPVIEYIQSFKQQASKMLQFNKISTQTFLIAVDSVLTKIIQVIWQKYIDPGDLKQALDESTQRFDKFNKILADQKQTKDRLINSMNQKLVSLKPTVQKLKQIKKLNQDQTKELSNRIRNMINDIGSMLQNYYLQPSKQYTRQKQFVQSYTRNNFAQKFIQKLSQSQLFVTPQTTTYGSYKDMYVSIDEWKSACYKYINTLNDIIKESNQLQNYFKYIRDGISHRYWKCRYQSGIFCEVAWDWYHKISLDKFQIVRSVFHQFLVKVRQFKSKFEQKIPIFSQNQKQRNQYDQSVYDWLVQIMNAVISEQQFFNTQITNYKAVNDYINQIGPDMINQILLRNLSEYLINSLTNNLPAANQKIYDLQKDNLPSLLTFYKKQLQNVKQNIILDPFIAQYIKFIQTIPPLLNQYIENPFQNFKDTFENSVNFLIDFLKKMQDYHGNFWAQVKQMRLLNNRTQDFIQITQNQTDNAPFFSSFSEYEESVIMLNKLSKFLLSNYTQKYKAFMSSSLLIFTTFRIPDLSDEKREQLEAFFNEQFTSKIEMDFVNTYFVGFLDKSYDLLTIIKNLDYDLRLLYLAADILSNKINPYQQGLVILIQERMQIARTGFSNFTQLDINFKVAVLNEYSENIKKNSQNLFVIILNYIKETSYYQTINALSKIKKKTILAQSTEILSIYVQNINYIVVSIQSIDSFLKSQFAQVNSLLEKFSLSSINSILQLIQLLNSLPEDYMEQLKTQLEFAEQTKTALQQNRFDLLIKAPQNLKNLLQNSKKLFRSQVNSLLDWTIGNCTKLQISVNQRIKQRLQTVINIATAARGNTLNNIEIYFTDVQKKIKQLQKKLKSLDIDYFKNLRLALDKSVQLKSTIQGRVDLVSKKCDQVGNTMKNIFNLNAYNLSKLKEKFSNISDEIVNEIQLFVSLDQIKALQIAEIFKLKPAIQKLIRAPFVLLGKALQLITRFVTKIKDMIRKAFQSFKQKAYDKCDKLKQAEGYAKGVIQKIKQQPQNAADNRIVLFQKKSQNLLQALKFEFNQTLDTPVGSINIYFGIKFNAYVGVRILLIQFRTVGGQFYIESWVDAYFGLKYGNPQILQFQVALVGKFLDFRFTTGLYFENIVPMTFIAIIKDDEDMKNQGKSSIRLKISVSLKTIIIKLRLYVNILWFQFVSTQKQICFVKCWKINIKLPKKTMKKIDKPDSVLYQGPTYQKDLLDKKLTQFVLWG